MTQDERRRFLLAALLRERTPSRAPALPPDADGQRLLLRALLNLRPPAPVGQTFLRVQDAYLQEELRRRGITDAADLAPVRPGLYLWRGDLDDAAVRRDCERRQQPSARLLLSQPRVR